MKGIYGVYEASHDAMKVEEAMKMLVFEGTAEEISKVVDTLQSTATGTTLSVKLPDESSPSTMRSEVSGESTRFVSTAFARRVLTRRRLSGPVMAMLKTLYESHPEWVSSATLYDATGYTPAQFAGLKGAFGRRMSKTTGYDAQAEFFEWKENKETGEWEYRLPDTVREALRLEGLASQWAP